MEEPIRTVNRLQEVFAVVNERSGAKGAAELPRVVVVGEQGSGKTSVLEGLVGRSFLPRGPDLVTRRPLLLRLVYASKKELIRTSAELQHPGLEAWAVFLHKPDKKFLKFDEVRQEILEETRRVAGEQSGISSEPIVLRIYSNNMNLTLVDLPGLVRVPVGDRPQDAEQLALHYISAPHSIVLAVVTADTDIATSEALRLAKRVDPEGLRTLAVVTKLDLVRPETGAGDALSGRAMPVRLGVIGVVNRSQMDGLQGKAISQALVDEAAFFQLNYPKLASKHGTPYLAKKLQNLLLEHIRSCLPDMRNRVQSLMDHYQSVLKACGQPVQDKGQTLLRVLTEFCSEYCSLIKGNSQEIETKELWGGARISYIFQESFGKALDSIHPLSGFTKAAVLTAMKNVSGTRPGLFVPELSFELLVMRQIKRLEEPSLRCADLVLRELERMVLTTVRQCDGALSRFYNLRRRITEVCCDVLRAQLPETHATIRKLIAIQLAYINTTHPDLIRDAQELNGWIRSQQKEGLLRCGGSWSSVADSASVGHRPSTKNGPAAKRSLSRGSTAQPSSGYSDLEDRQTDRSLTVSFAGERERRDCLWIEHLIKSYFLIVRKSIQDSVPKAIMYCLVNDAVDNLQRQLVGRLYRPEQLDQLLAESKHNCQQRKETNDTLKALDKAANILNDVRDTHCLWPPGPNDASVLT